VLTGKEAACGRLEGAPPCPADWAYDSLQFANNVLDGWDSPWLSPYVPLFVEAGATEGGGGKEPEPEVPGGGKTGPGGAPSGGGTSAGGALTPARLIASAPRKARRAQLRRGLPVSVRVLEAGSRVTAKLALGRLTIAKRGARAAAPGEVALKLKPSRRGARRLAALKKAARATLTVVVTEPDGRRVTAKRKLRIRP
jgi:hypothetical protein